MRRLTPILGILLVAAALRIINAGHFPVWTDEGWSTWAASDHHFDVIIDKVLTKDRHPPLFALALSAWSTLVGTSRIALRFLAIAAGVLTVAAVYRLTADYFGRNPAIFSALLLAVLPAAVYYSQEIRHYSWLTLSVTLMTLFLLRYMQHPRIGSTSWFGYIVSTSIMLYTLYLGMFILAVQGVIGLFIWRTPFRNKLGLVAAWVVTAILYIPWLIFLPVHLRVLGDGIVGIPSSWEGLLTTASIIFGGQLALTIGLYLLGLWKVIERREKSSRLLGQITIILLGLGLYGLMFVGNLRIGLLAARTLVFLTPMLMVICGYGLSLLDKHARNLLAMSLVVMLPATTPPVQPRLDYHVAAQTVAADYTRDDLVILENGWDDNAFRYEILLALPGHETNDAQIIRTLPWVDNKQAPIPVVPQLKSRILDSRRVWVINWLQPSQVIPYLDQGSDGFIRAISRVTSVGAQYKALYTDQTVREILYERPDTAQTPRIYGELLALRDALLPTTMMRGEVLHVDCWWSALQQLPLDYSVGVFLIDASGTVKVQHDGPPADKPTSQWTIESLMFDRHSMVIPSDLPAGHYKVGVQVYWYGDRVPLQVGGEKYAVVGGIDVQ